MSHSSAGSRAAPVNESDRALIERLFSNPLVLPTIFKQWLVAYIGPEIQVTQSQVVNATTAVSIGAGSPEGVLAGGVGSLYLRTDGGAGTTIYTKESGTGTNGWVQRDVFTNGLTISDGHDVAIGGGTGSKIGQLTSKLGFFGKTPAGQQALTVDLLDALQALGLIASGAGNTPLDLTSGALAAGAITARGGLTISDAQDIVIAATTGSKVGQSTSKIGFYGATPILQQALTVDLLDALQALGLIASGAGNTPLDLTSGALSAGAILARLGLTLTDGQDIVIAATTGSKVGQSTSKIGFFGVTPVLRPGNTADVKAALAGLGLLTAGGASPLNLEGGILTGGADHNASTLRLPVGAGALTTTEGYAGWDSTLRRLKVYDSQRERSASDVGWQPYAYPVGGGPTDVVTTALALAANGGAIAIPVAIDGHMLLDGVTVRNLDTATARSWNWHLYEQRLNNGNVGENTLDRVATGAGGSFTPAAASNQTVAASGGPIYLAPGTYWLVVQSTHATSTFSLGTQAAGTLATNTAQTKTITNPAGATLDMVAATWTKIAALAGIRLNGRVFGQTTAF